MYQYYKKLDITRQDPILNNNFIEINNSFSTIFYYLINYYNCSSILWISNIGFKLIENTIQGYPDIGNKLIFENMNLSKTMNKKSSEVVTNANLSEILIDEKYIDQLYELIILNYIYQFTLSNNKYQIMDEYLLFYNLKYFNSYFYKNLTNIIKYLSIQYKELQFMKNDSDDLNTDNRFNMKYVSDVMKNYYDDLNIDNNFNMKYNVTNIIKNYSDDFNIDNNFNVKCNISDFIKNVSNNFNHHFLEMEFIVDLESKYNQYHVDIEAYIDDWRLLQYNKKKAKKIDKSIVS